MNLGAVLSWIGLLGCAAAAAVPAGELESAAAEEKKVYADYHGPRRTRPHDGELGLWSHRRTARESTARQTTFTYNADLIRADGRREIAASAYPAVGMQSQLDPDYLEYQILLAKAAGIDGFFVEWGFPGHSCNDELQALLTQARRFDFEIGVNWCDAWLFNWAAAVNPRLADRGSKVAYFGDCLQYLLANVYSRPVGARLGGQPVIFLFGGGIAADEFRGIASETADRFPVLAAPQFFRRAPIGGVMDGDKVVYKFSPNAWTGKGGGAPLVSGVFGLAPPGVRLAGAAGLRDWDRYATPTDAVRYLETLIASFEDTRGPTAPRISSVTPGSDNRHCAGWGRDLSTLSREGGRTYRAMWDFNVRHRSKIDAVYIVSWNDYTEGHQIEPTMEDGDRELRTTAEFAARFKGTPVDSSGFDLAGRLFGLRKTSEVLQQVGLAQPSANRLLAGAADALSRRDPPTARTILNRVEGMIAPQENSLLVRNLAIRLPSPSARCQPLLQNRDEVDLARGLAVTLDDRLSRELQSQYFDGVLSFEYLDQTSPSIVVRTDSTSTNKRKAVDVLCDLQPEGSGQWRAARVEFSKENCRIVAPEARPCAFYFNGECRIRNIEFQFRFLTAPVSSGGDSLRDHP